MGTIAATGPIAAAMSEATHCSPALAMATVVGGSMFGDNLSIVSDTTIASVLSQGADIGKKFRFNARIALLAGALTRFALLFTFNGHGTIPQGIYSLLLISLYFILLAFALNGVNVLIALTIAIAGGIGLCMNNNYGFIALNNSIHRGFVNMGDLVILSLFIGGLSGLISKNLIQKIAATLSSWNMSRSNGTKTAQLLIGMLAGIFDLMVANNTIAIVLCSGIAKEIANKNAILPHVSATWLGSFSCVFQGIISYAPQLLLAGAIARISPLSITPYVIYCYLRFFVSIFYLLRVKG
jgi:Na+/H+ antiporter NhaC